MRHFFKFALIMISLSFNSATGATIDPLRLKPSSKWTVDYQKDSCSLARQFGDGKNMIRIYMTRFKPTDFFEMIIVGNGINAKSDRVATKIQFGPHEKTQERSFYIAKSVGNIPTMMLKSDLRIAPPTEAEQKILNSTDKKPDNFLMNPITEQQETAVQYIAIDVHKKQKIILETGSLKGAFSALKKCNNELLKHWGIDVEKHSTLSQLPIPINNPSKWLNTNDYPHLQLRQGNIGIIQFRLSISENGEPLNCNIQRAIGDEAFEKSVCKNVMKKAKFHPALDKDGQPMASYWINRVRFVFEQ